MDRCSAASVRGERCSPCICSPAEEYEIIRRRKDDNGDDYDGFNANHNGCSYMEAHKR